MRSGEQAFPIGAHLQQRRGTFCVWAPWAHAVELVLNEPRALEVRMQPDNGHFVATVDDIEEGQRYGFRVDGSELLPDPASRHQPDGVHGLSSVLSSEFPWRDGGWQGPAMQDYVMYELHVGTFTPEGTFEAAAARVPALHELGITVIELMPVAQFPGDRNWGYDGVLPFAVQNSYGGPRGLKHFVDECHRAGMAVCLDVVYNHMGPEGNILGRFGPYFTHRYHTPWGDALNFDDAHSDHVREYFVSNALQWVDEFHIDALRLDAVHAIMDRSAQPFLRELADCVHRRATALQRNIALIAESDLGDPRMIRPSANGGLGMDAQWLDDFHHALHTVLTGEQTGYYRDFGRLDHLARAFREGFVYAGQYSEFRKRRHGAPAIEAAPHQFVVYAQNHDQIGNRMLGDRLSSSLTFEQLKLTAAAVLLSPFTPLLFMGEEYCEVAPFPYFVSHTEPQLVEAVRRGRAEEFEAFAWAGEPPDPQAETTFRSAVLDWNLRDTGKHAVLLALHRELLRLRTELAPLRGTPNAVVEANTRPAESLLQVRYGTPGGDAVLLLHFGTAPLRTTTPPGREWRIRFDSAGEDWHGPGRVEPDVLGGDCTIELAPHSAVLLVSTGAAA